VLFPCNNNNNNNNNKCNSLCCSSPFSPLVDYGYPCFGLRLLPEYGPFWVPIYLHVGL
jgi:hypothetical protein